MPEQDNSDDWELPLGDPLYVCERTYHNPPIIYRDHNVTLYQAKIRDIDINPLHYV